MLDLSTHGHCSLTLRSHCHSQPRFNRIIVKVYSRLSDCVATLPTSGRIVLFCRKGKLSEGQSPEAWDKRGKTHCSRLKPQRQPNGTGNE